MRVSAQGWRSTRLLCGRRGTLSPDCCSDNPNAKQWHMETQLSLATPMLQGQGPQKGQDSSSRAWHGTWALDSSVVSQGTQEDMSRVSEVLAQAHSMQCWDLNPSVCWKAMPFSTPPMYSQQLGSPPLPASFSHPEPEQAWMAGEGRSRSTCF